MREFKRNFVKLHLLLWKQYHLRKNHWILSLIDLLFPILIFWCIAKFGGDFIIFDGMETYSAVVHLPVPVQNVTSDHHPFKCVLYTPRKPALNDLMEEYREYFNKIPVNVIGVDNEADLKVAIGNQSAGSNYEYSKCIGVVFTEYSTLIHPIDNDNNRFSYTLRSSEKLSIDKVYNADDGPIIYDPYLYSGFATVQIALNEAFSRYRGKGQIYDQLSLEAFPYAEYELEKNRNRLKVASVVCYALLVTALVLSIPLITIIIEEKSNGLKESMRIVGMEEWLIWLGWFLYALLQSVISYTIVTYILLGGFSNPGSVPIRNVDPLVLWSCIMLYCAANIAFCFVFTAIFHQSIIASCLYVITIAFITYFSTYLSHRKFWYLRRMACLLPNAAFYLALNRIEYTEIHGIYIGWSDVFHSGPSTLPLGYTFVMLIFDTILYIFLAYYIGAISPGKFGARKSPFFIFQPLMSSLKIKRDHQKFRDLDDPPADQFVEKSPSNLEAIIKIRNLHKYFGSMHSVRGINLNVYKGEITALLGHNGAGKTTTLAILAGMLKHTEGRIVYKDELDVLQKMDKFRQNLGVCWQEDRLFPYLSVLNHLLFFGLLKGKTTEEATQESKEFLKLMEIEDKANSLPAHLSGGQKRKLCLGIALMGKTEMLILDEPTSGLDVESRRKLWHLLLEMRGSRTIILTTHLMEEADALGDRIAIMQRGSIVCHGTSSFLKKSFNTGYRVTIKKDEETSETALTNVMKNSNVANVSVESSSPEEVIYKLPLTETFNFPDLFIQLENKRTELGFKTIGVSCTTMEQVFLKVGEPSTSGTLPLESSNSDGEALGKYPHFKRSGHLLIMQQMYALLLKKLLYTSRDWVNLFYRVIFPTLIMIVLMYAVKINQLEKPLQIDFAFYPNTKIMVQNTSTSWPIWDSFQTHLRPNGIELIASKGKNITDGLLNYSRQDLDSYNHDIILAMEWRGGDERNIKLLYNRFALHSLPLGLNLFAAHVIESRDKIPTEFLLNLHPLRESNGYPEYCWIFSNYDWLVVLWFIILAFYTVDLNTYFITSVNVEHLNGFKHIQLVSIVSPITYWISNFIFDFIFFFLIVLARMIIFKSLGDDYGFLVVDRHTYVLIFIVAIFIGSCLPFTYVATHLSNSENGSYLLLFLVNIISSIIVSIVYFSSNIMNTENLGCGLWALVLQKIVDFSVLLIPPMNYSLIVIKFTYTWFDNKKCIDCERRTCPEIEYLVFQSSDHENGILREVLFLVFDMFLYSTLLAAIQLGYFEKLKDVVMISIYDSSSRGGKRISEEDGCEVQVEMATLNRSVTNRSGYNTEEILIAHKLSKNFVKSFRPVTAVADVNFKVNAGECFGLLGMNGAGKSTTFRMLTGDLLPTTGNSSVMGFTLSSNRIQYLSRVGYCPQKDSLLENLTGREMLSLIASLRGLHPNQISHVIEKWLVVLGLEEYQNQRCRDYSGGNKRKLCIAMSFIGDPTVVFLDEPTTGVDMFTRRRLYTVMEQSRESGQAVVLTSHSMEECENLCDRMTILVDGQMLYIDTAQNLKQTYAQGFSILVNVSDSATGDAVQELKERMMDEFSRQCVLTDEHKTKLFFQITDTNLEWSTLFRKMENLKERNKNIMVDYTLSDTSLEEVFMSLSKRNNVKILCD